MIHTQMTHPLLLPTQSGPPTEIMECLNFNRTKERIRQISITQKKLISPLKSQRTTLPLRKFSFASYVQYFSFNWKKGLVKIAMYKKLIPTRRTLTLLCMHLRNMILNSLVTFGLLMKKTDWWKNGLVVASGKKIFRISCALFVSCVEQLRPPPSLKTLTVNIN